MGTVKTEGSLMSLILVSMNPSNPPPNTCQSLLFKTEKMFLHLKLLTVVSLCLSYK